MHLTSYVDAKVEGEQRLGHHICLRRFPVRHNFYFMDSCATNAILLLENRLQIHDDYDSIIPGTVIAK